MKNRNSILSKTTVSILLAVLMLLVPNIICDETLIFASADTVTKSSANTQLSDNEKTNYYLIYNGLTENKSEITVLTNTVNKEWINNVLIPLYFRVVNENPELFYVGSRMSYRYLDSIQNPTRTVTVLPEYTMSQSELPAARAVYEEGVNSILEGINSSWSDLEKVVYVNDYIASHFRYDTEYENYDAHSFFKDGKGVCEAYTAVFIAVMKELDIPVSSARSESMNHVWNLVQVDGEWYHIDVTWNDPLPDKPGKANHTNLLLSDTGITETGHYDWEADYECTSTKYDDHFWKDYKTPFAFINDKVYAVNSEASSGGVYSVDLSSGTSSLVFSITDRWYVEGSSTRFWNGCYSGIGKYNNYICYNTPNKIMMYDTITGKHSTLYTYSGSGSIYGIHVDGKTLTYYVGKSPNDEITKGGTVTISESAKYKITYMVDGSVYSTQSYKAGDKVTNPGDPTREGYIFKGWSPSVPSTMPESNITVKAVFECAHSKTHVERKEATCAEDGYVKKICDICGEVISRETIPATDEHSFGDWVVVKEPTETSEGVRKKTCEVCGKVVTETIPPLPTTSETTSTASTTNVSDVDTSDSQNTSKFIDISENSDVVSASDFSSGDNSDATIVSNDEKLSNQETTPSDGKSVVSYDKGDNSYSSENWYIYIIVAVSIGVIAVVVIVLRKRMKQGH